MRPVLFFVLLSSLLSRAAPVGEVQPTPAYRNEVIKWRHDRESRLKAEDGWLSLVGLFWLKEGDNRIGTAETAEVKLARGPAEAAILTMHSGKAHLTVKPGAPVTVDGKPVKSADVHSDAGRIAPSVITVGNCKLLIIHRGSRDAVRVKDPESPARREFTGLKWFPISTAWRVEARFVPYAKPKKIVLDTMVGEKDEEVSPGYAAFERDGQQIRLEAIADGDELSFIFRDKTAGKTTYPAARFLDTDLPKNGKVILDFNLAYNPPCAFTPYATCPLPTPQNRLSIAIAAGEMMYHSKEQH